MNQSLVQKAFDDIIAYIDVKFEDLTEEESDILTGLLKDEF